MDVTFSSDVSLFLQGYSVRYVVQILYNRRSPQALRLTVNKIFALEVRTVITWRLRCICVHPCAFVFCLTNHLSLSVHLRIGRKMVADKISPLGVALVRL